MPTVDVEYRVTWVEAELLHGNDYLRIRAKLLGAD
jgi:hypothetical protein